MKRIAINQTLSFDYTGPKDRESILLARFNHMKNIGFSDEYIDAQLLSNGYSVTEIRQLFNQTKLNVMNTLEGNKLIAEFMGAKDHKNARAAIAERLGSMDLWLPYHGIVRVERLEYHTSWDWLMPCVIEIERIGGRVEIVCHVCRITITRDREFKFVTSENLTKLEATYKTVLSFIEWYNNQK